MNGKKIIIVLNELYVSLLKIYTYQNVYPVPRRVLVNFGSTYSLNARNYYLNQLWLITNYSPRNKPHSNLD